MLNCKDFALSITYVVTVPAGERAYLASTDIIPPSTNKSVTFWKLGLGSRLVKLALFVVRQIACMVMCVKASQNASKALDAALQVFIKWTKRR